MKSTFSKLVWLAAAGIVAAGAIAACGGGSGGGGDLRIQGTLRTAAASRTAQTAGQGIQGVTVNALGDSVVTDANGDFSLQGGLVPGGEVLFEFVSDLGTATNVVSGLPVVPATAVIAFTANPDGTIDSEITSIVESGAAAPSPAPTETASPEPTATETASPEPTATETASPEPTETASPEPTETGTPGRSPACEECVATGVSFGFPEAVVVDACTNGNAEFEIAPNTCP